MPLVLISATPSPFARANRVAMLEKGIEFELKSEVPWSSATETPKYNPLEKLPILLTDDGPVYDSAHIQEYIVQKYASLEPKLLPEGIDAGLKARQIQVLAEGQMDAVGLIFFEEAREHPSAEWLARQNRKVDGAFKAYADLVQHAQGEFLVDNTFSIADIAVACGVRMVEFTNKRPGWQEQYPGLATWWKKIEERESFQKTLPVMFELTEKVV